MEHQVMVQAVSQVAATEMKHQVMAQEVKNLVAQQAARARAALEAVDMEALVWEKRVGLLRRGQSDTTQNCSLDR